jgi:hypothetical protein
MRNEIMRKIITLSIIGFLIISGLGVIATNNDKSINQISNSKLELTNVVFPQLTINKLNDCIALYLENVSTYLMEPGFPMIPKIVKYYELPFGVKNVKVEVTPKNILEFEIEEEIQPAPMHLPLSLINIVKYTNIKINEKVYLSENPYPNSWFEYRICCGLNNQNERVTYVILNIFPVKYIPKLNKIYFAENADIELKYDLPKSTIFPKNSEYELVIITPARFYRYLIKLQNHKIANGINTFIKKIEDIYKEYTGYDKPEQIKLFIKDAIEKYNITYVLLVGGLKSKIWSRPRDDPNQGTKGWYLPVRYNNLYDNPEHPLKSEVYFDPGVITDLYYADIYDGEGNFSSWDPNGDGIYAAWGMPNVTNDTNIDMVPDVSLGRLACASSLEVRNVVKKIIKYEKTAADPSWFKKIIVVSGDGFLDQEDLDFQWDTNNRSNGKYVIKAQSFNPDGISGPIEIINITIDKNVNTSITFNHDDYLRIKSYPGNPIAEIVSISEGDILGKNDFEYIPNEGQAYGNSFTNWANINYTNGILHIRGKTYDPKPYGNITNINVFIENENGEVVFSDWRNNSEMYYEGEWITGEKLLFGGGGALYYMPEDFEKIIIWTSNGNLTNQKDVIKALSQGSGFAFLSGHGSPNVWADHYPGIPGNRAHGSVTGLYVIGIRPYKKFISFPIFPMKKIKNINKLPVVLIGGCHNSQFNVSMIRGFFDVYNKRSTWCHGYPVPECFSWYLVKMPRTGAIATIGNTGLGYGTLGKYCNIGGLDGGICIEFFKQYAKKYNQNGFGILGDVYTQTLVQYTIDFDIGNMDHAKSLSQWVLLGDPSLRIGGYS